MENKLIPKAIETKRVILDSDESKAHYIGVKKIAIMPLLFGLLLLWSIITGGTIIHISLVMIFFFLLAFTLFLFFNQWNRLAFKTITTPLSRSEINLIIEEVAKELKWKVNVNNKNIAKAFTYPSFFSGSWGEMITIIFDGETVMINSICNPRARPSLSAMGRNRKNEQRFLKKIKNNSHSKQV